MSKTLQNIVLVNPPAHRGKRRSTPFQLGYLESLLKEAGFSVNFIDFQGLIGLNDIPFPEVFFEAALMELNKQTGSLFVFQVATSAAPWAFELMRITKTLFPDSKIVATGRQVRGLRAHIQKEVPWVDFLVVAEVEPIIAQLASCVLHSDCSDWDQIPGIDYRTETGNWARSIAPIHSQNMDNLPMLDVRFGNVAEGDVCSLEVGRGCSQGCLFCAGKAAGGTAVRTKSARRIVQEAGAIFNGHPNPSQAFVMFEAEDFSDVKLLKEILTEKQRTQTDFLYCCYARIRCLSEEYMDLLAATGCRYVFLGVESGSARVLRTINKGTKPGDALRTVSALLKRGIHPLCSLIYGFPNETVQEWQQTMDHCAELQWAGATVHLSPMRIEPGSALSQKVARQDYVCLRDCEHYQDLLLAGLDPKPILPEFGVHYHSLRNEHYDIAEAFSTSTRFMHYLEHLPVTMYTKSRLQKKAPSTFMSELDALVEQGANMGKDQAWENAKQFFGTAHAVQLQQLLQPIVIHELSLLHDKQGWPRMKEMDYMQLYEKTSILDPELLPKHPDLVADK